MLPSETHNARPITRSSARERSFHQVHRKIEAHVPQDEGFRGMLAQILRSSTRSLSQDPFSRSARPFAHESVSDLGGALVAMKDAASISIATVADEWSALEDAAIARFVAVAEGHA